MTPDAFRLLVLSRPGALLVSKLGNVGFGVGQKVFATLGAPDAAFAALRLSVQDQAGAIAAAPAVFTPQPGGPGRRGWTQVRLAVAQVEDLKPWVAAAHRLADERRA